MVKCDRNIKVRGWKCVIDHSDDSWRTIPGLEDATEPCGMVPVWWNIWDRHRYGWQR